MGLVTPCVADTSVDGSPSAGGRPRNRAIGSVYAVSWRWPAHRLRSTHSARTAADNYICAGGGGYGQQVALRGSEPRSRTRSLGIARRRLESGRRRWDRSLPADAGRRVRELDLATHVVALCAQQMLCTAPLVVAMSAVLQRTAGQGLGGVSAKFFGLKHEAAHAVTALLGRTQASIGTTALVLSLITAVVFSTSVGAVQQRAFELIWALPRVSGVQSYLRQLAWAVGLGVFSLGMLFAGILGKLINHNVVSLGFLTGAILQAALIVAFYLWSQHWLLQGRIAYRALVPGSVAIALGAVLMFRISRQIVPQQIVWQSHAYGSIGVVFVLSTWLMALCMVIFGGALVGTLISQRRAPRRDQPVGLIRRGARSARRSRAHSPAPGGLATTTTAPPHLPPRAP